MKSPRPPMPGAPVVPARYFRDSVAQGDSHTPGIALGEGWGFYMPGGVIQFGRRRRRGGKGFSGLVYVKGQEVDLRGEQAKAFVRIFLNVAPYTAVYSDTWEVPFPPGEIYRRVAGVSGDIYVD